MNVSLLYRRRQAVKFKTVHQNRTRCFLNSLLNKTTAAMSQATPPCKNTFAPILMHMSSKDTMGDQLPSKRIRTAKSEQYQVHPHPRLLQASPSFTASGTILLRGQTHVTHLLPLVHRLNQLPHQVAIVMLMTSRQCPTHGRFLHRPRLHNMG